MGLETGKELDVPLPVAALVHQIIVEGIGNGLGEQDFASLLTKSARGAGLNIESENKKVSDGLV